MDWNAIVKLVAQLLPLIVSAVQAAQASKAAGPEKKASVVNTVSVALNPHDTASPHPMNNPSVAAAVDQTIESIVTLHKAFAAGNSSVIS